jgi:hypothetical protein
MNCFQIVKEVLDRAYKQIPGNTDEKDAAIQSELQRLAGQYAGLSGKYAAIDYSQPITRFAYVYRYVTSHANLVCTVIKRSSTLRELFTNERVTVSALGGGPGSDIVGILKYLEGRPGATERLYCHIFDGETAWGETWITLLQEFEDDLRVYPAFNQFDAADPSTWSKFTTYLGADLFTMVYFASELYGIRDKVAPFFEHVMSHSGKAAKFLYIDNRSECFTQWIDELAATHGLKPVEQDAGGYQLPFEEEKTDLSPYFGKFPHPKITADIAWRVYAKG